MTRIYTVALALTLTGCFFDTMPQAVVVDGGAGACAPGARESDAALGCYNPLESPALVASATIDPYPPPPLPDWLFLGENWSIDGPLLEFENGFGANVEVDQWIPGLPLFTLVEGADTCRPTADCLQPVGVVTWEWVPVPWLLEIGLYPFSPTMISTCSVLPRPLCDAAGARHTAQVETALRDAGYVQIVANGQAGFIPDFNSPRFCRTTVCQLRLGRAVARACAEANRWQFDLDGDGAGNSCDNCMVAANATQSDRDGDGRGDTCDVCPDDPRPGAEQDVDGDGLPGCDDNCPIRANPNQRDTDGDGAGDACDADDDNDGLSDIAEAALGTDPRRRDTDGDGRWDPHDNCPTRSNPDQADPDGDGRGSACDICPEDADPEQEDEDEDGVGDACDNCRDAANADQLDADEDGIGDTCCGEADPDGDGWDNCAWYSAAYRAERDIPDQTGAPEAVHPMWVDQDIPGAASCAGGVRRCVPAGPTPTSTVAGLRAGVLDHIRAGRPNVEQAPPGSPDAHLGLCSARAERMPPDQLSPAWWAACLEDPSAPAVPDPAVAAPVEVEFGGNPRIAAQFGLIGQRVIWWLGGYAARGDCDYDQAYRVLMPDGHLRHGEWDIQCLGTVRRDDQGRLRGQPGQLIEVKWWRTSVTTWPDDRAASFIDQIERHYAAFLNAQVEDPTVRLIWLFGWNPPLTAEHILSKSPAYDFGRIIGRDAGALIYPEIPFALPIEALLDRFSVDPWRAGPYYWTTFVPSDFEPIPGLFDEAPCFPCSEHDDMCERGGLVGAWRDVSLHWPECEVVGRAIYCDFIDAEVTVARYGSVYVDQPALLRWLGIYKHACIHGRGAGCNPWLSRLYDRVKCRGLHPSAARLVEEDPQ